MALTKILLCDIIVNVRLMTMSPLYPCGKPCSTGTHIETVKKLALFSAIINGSIMESRLRILHPVEMLSVIQSHRKFYHIYRNSGNSQISQSDRLVL